MAGQHLIVKNVTDLKKPQIIGAGGETTLET